MFKEHSHAITALRAEDGHFNKLFDKHSELDDKIDAIEAGTEHAEGFELETMKKSKLKIKDEIYSIVMDFKKNNNY